MTKNEWLESLMRLHPCADCPIRCQAAKKPRSIFARIHRWHLTWWPGWKIYLKGQRTALPSLAMHSEVSK